MVQVPLVAGNTEITVTARVRATWVPSDVLDPPGGLFPLMSAGFEIDEYRIRRGWPIPVPDADIRVNCLMSAEGAKLSHRDDPTSVITGADMRWIADANFYDQTTGQWTPIQSNVSPWYSDPAHTPTLITDYEYQLGDERFTDMTALNFDSDTQDCMTNDLGLSMGGIDGYTVIMVLNPNSIYGNDPEVVENVLWGPQEIDGAWALFAVRDQAVYMTTESQQAKRGVVFANAMSSTAPSYLALVIGRPTTTMYAAAGPNQIQARALAAGEVAESLSTRFWLGNAPFPASETMDMALFDLSVYGRMLTRAQVAAEFSELCKIYGGAT